MKNNVILCLVLVVMMIVSSCTPSTEILKDMSLQPQSNIVQYSIDKSLDNIPKENFIGKKISIVSFEINIDDINIQRYYANYFIKQFENKIGKSYNLKNADVFFAVDITYSYVAEDLTDFKPEIKKPKITSAMYVNFIPLEEFPLGENNIQEEPKYKFNKNDETIITRVALLAMEVKTGDIIYYNDVTCVSVCSSISHSNMREDYKVRK